KAVDATPFPPLAAHTGQQQLFGSVSMEHTKRIKLVRQGRRRAKRMPWPLVCAALMIAAAVQAHADPYFSVSTDRTFLPKEKITVHLYTRDVEALEFR